MLEDLGARYVFSASDGASALQVIAEREPPIDVIVSDVDMPGMDGMEFMRHLGAAHYSASVILASALDPRLLGGIESMARAYNLRVLGVITSPSRRRSFKASSHCTTPMGVPGMPPRRPSPRKRWWTASSAASSCRISSRR